MQHPRYFIQTSVLDSEHTLENAVEKLKTEGHSTKLHVEKCSQCQVDEKSEDLIQKKESGDWVEYEMGLELGLLLGNWVCVNGYLDRPFVPSNKLLLSLTFVKEECIFEKPIHFLCVLAGRNWMSLCLLCSVLWKGTISTVLFGG